MAWRRPGDKPLSEPMIVSVLTQICVTRPQWVNSATHITNTATPLQWRQNGRYSVSNHQPHDCVLNRLFRRRCSASLAFVRGIHRGPGTSPHKWPVMRKIFPFDDVIMITHWRIKLRFHMCGYDGRREILQHLECQYEQHNSLTLLVLLVG